MRVSWGQGQKAHNSHPVPDLSLGELPPKDELTEQYYLELKRQWDVFKEHFVEESLPLVGSLEDVVNWYFQIEPPFFPGKKQKEFPDAFILSALESYHQEHQASIAVVSSDGDFMRSCATRPYMTHYSRLEKYAEAFKPELSEDRMPEPVDPTEPIVTEDLTELKAILRRGSQVTSLEMDRAVRLLRSRGENYRYFFLNVSDPLWLEKLCCDGFFDHVPMVDRSVEGSIRIPDWSPIYYLVQVFDSRPDEVLDILERLPETDNPQVLAQIVEIVLKSDSPSTLHRLAPRVRAFVDHVPWAYNKVITLLQSPYFFETSLDGFASSLLLQIVEFRPDPQSEEKQARRNENPDDWTTSLEPVPRFDQWEYQEILEKGVRPLAETEPYEVARILIDSTASMVRLKMHQEDLYGNNDEDLSEFWCRRLDWPECEYPDSEDALVQTLTFACEMVFERSSESIAVLNETLRNQRWKIFHRLRQHLYSLHPNEQTEPWIRDSMLVHGDYARWEHHYEFQRMIRSACERFGAALLTEEERTQVFDAILEGPSKEHFREWMGEQFTEEKFEQRQRYFHRMQLRPFATVLFGEYASYFRELEGGFDAEISDEEYSPLGESGGGSVSRRSPRSAEDLRRLDDAELLTFINEWQDERRDEDDWLVEINIEALAEAIQTVFKESIIPDPERLRFWIENREQIERPIYVRAMINGMEEETKAKDFSRLSKWLEFCEWVLAHPDEGNGEGLWRRDQSRDDPNWHDSRRAVGDLVGACLEQDVDVLTLPPTYPHS